MGSSVRRAVPLTSLIPREHDPLVRLHVRDADGERDGGYSR